ncbi:L,D-transpeptidase [Bifidobacterium boum]|uniref:ErfK/YbiS/YcfS/YnhG superfamily protein n=1 Tax=Bifidobacterium boum TaxID=78343 RepID=A0A086ZQ65_9BIFI|nr:L,D-transpeptidase [Bifidobacterium boum]KFI48665.1 ErfK/YbiS/YcfS/YnhG superfamily protein [Bifidobacterium boum]
MTNTSDGFVSRYGAGSPSMANFGRIPAQPDAPGDVWKGMGGMEPNDDTLSGMEIPLYAVADGGAADTDAEMAQALRPPHKRVWLIVLLSILGVIVVAAVAGFFTARWYYQDKAAPGITFAGVSVAGQNRAQLADTVKQAVNATKITVTDQQGNTVTASLKDLGVAVNEQQTVSELVSAKNANPFMRINPFAKQSVKLAATTDKLALSEYLTGKLITPDQQAIASTISYDDASSKFVVNAGRGGQTPVIDTVTKAVDQAIDQPGSVRTTSVSYTQTDMPISEAAAAQAADQANAGLALTITVNNGDVTTYKIPAATIASWTTTTADPAKGTIAVSYNKQAISEYMASELGQHLNQTKTNQVDLVDASGNVIMTKTKGVNGVAIKDTATVADQVYSALSGNRSATLTVASDVTTFDTEQQKVTWKIVVDRFKQTATVYNNDQVVQTFNVCTGKTGKHETTPGNYFIYLKYKVQDMRGSNDDGSQYLTPGVKWISYFNGGQGFHTANWNASGIASGDPTGHGSHGCVNMNEADAKWIYDNCPEGTLVQVVGAQPTSPVR